MHIPDGFLTPPVWATLDAVAVGTVAYAVKRVEREFDPEDWQVPLMGVTAAFVFAAQMFNFPVAGGTSGHLLGATLATALLGPWRAMLVMTAVFLVQALAFADGGVFALGANLFNMGILGCLIAHGLIQILWRLSGQQEWGRQAGIALAAWWSVELGAVATAVELALSGRIPLSIVLPAMAGVHAFIGVGEALLTVAAVNLVVRVRPELVPAEPTPWLFPAGRRPAWVRWAVALVIALALVPFASSLPDGLEWVAHQLGFEDAAQDTLAAPLPDYTVPGLPSEALATLLSAIIGAGLVVGLLAFLGLRRRKTDQGGE